MKSQKLKQEQCIEQGKRLNRCLKEKGIKQRDFADMVGFTPQYVSNIINGKGIPADHIDLFADLLEVSPDYLRLKSNYANAWEELASELDAQQKTDNACISFLAALGYTIQDIPGAAAPCQITFTPDETEPDILAKAKRAKERAVEQPEPLFRIVTPSGKRKQLSKHDLLRLISEVQAFTRAHLDLRIGR